jgi:hypothetical protein
VKYADELVEKKLETFFQASALVVLKARPTLVKYADELVEKKLFAALYASAEVVAQERPTDEKYVADVVEKKLAVFFQASAEVVEKKNPLLMFVRYDEESEVVATTLPCAFVERSAFGMLEMARLVVVALVAVAFPRMFRFPLIVDDAPERRPPLKVRSDVVALFGNGSWSVVPVASVPQERTPNWFAFTSQLAELRFETMSCVVDAVPETARFVVVAFVVVVFWKTLPPVKVLLE